MQGQYVLVKLLSYKDKSRLAWAIRKALQGNSLKWAENLKIVSLFHH